MEIFDSGDDQSIGSLESLLQPPDPTSSNFTNIAKRVSTIDDRSRRISAIEDDDF